MTERASELRTQSLFRDLEQADLDRIAPLIEEMRYAKDDYIFRENEPCRGIHLMRSGKVEISKTTPDGWRQPLVHLSKDHFLGEIALLERSNHGTDAQVIEPAELYFLPKEAFENMERQAPAIMLKIIKNIAIIGGLNVRRMNEKFLKVLVNY